MTGAACNGRFEAAEFATLEWVDWSNNRRLLEPTDNIPPGAPLKSYASWMRLTLGERAYYNDVPGVGAAVEACIGTSRVASPIAATFHCRSCLASRPSATPHPSKSEFGRF